MYEEVCFGFKMAGEKMEGAANPGSGKIRFLYIDTIAITNHQKNSPLWLIIKRH